MSKDTWTIHIDGASRGNPGPSACAFVIARPGEAPLEHAQRLSDTTNNVAEYTALLQALQRASELGGRRLSILSDSELLVKQINGEYRVKNADLRVLYAQVQDLLSKFDKVSVRHIPREQNGVADALCNRVLNVKPAAPRQPTPKAGGEFRVHDQAIDCLRTAAAA